MQRRVLGQEHPDTLSSASNLAAMLGSQEKYAEAERINLELLGVRRRVLGDEHPDTLTSANNLATALALQGKYAEAEEMGRAVLEARRRVLGSAHPHTLGTAESLEFIRSNRAKAPTKAPTFSAVTPTVASRPHPFGTRVVVQRLVAKPELNGKSARVLSFDARTGRYAVALDDGKELSLKAECVSVTAASVGCAAAGCTSEEASSVCARCRAVSYCSRECQRADWRAHKPACVAAAAHRVVL